MDIKQVLLEKIEEQTPKIKNAVRIWSLQDPKLLYVTKEQADGYLALEDSADYKSGMHDAETDLIQRNLEHIISQLQNDIQVIDMGCGEALKTIEILKEAKKGEKRIVFYPIDISDKILDIAVKNAEEAGIETYGLQEDFEQFDQILSKVKPGSQRVIYLGANFVNFDSDSLLTIIKNGMKNNDLVYFSAQISKGNIKQIVKEYYNQENYDFLFPTINRLGFNPEDVSYQVRFNPDTREMEMYFIIKRMPLELEDSKLRVGDELLIGTSYKPTLNEFSQIAQKYFTGRLLFNKDKTYVGFLGRKK